MIKRKNVIVMKRKSVTVVTPNTPLRSMYAKTYAKTNANHVVHANLNVRKTAKMYVIVFLVKKRNALLTATLCLF